MTVDNLALYLVLEEREPVFSIKYDVIIRFFIDALSQVEKFPTLLRVAFLKNQKWILNFVKSASIELFLWFFFYAYHLMAAKLLLLLLPFK